ncbi:unnamed protein product [Orchesella dallaii]|uniref:Uncharacterized protein n=1 Tax=Orchesella dallaii TaxID=48710 RepID=A0ABP1RGU6_9HEXA
MDMGEAHTIFKRDATYQGNAAVYYNSTYNTTQQPQPDVSTNYTSNATVYNYSTYNTTQPDVSTYSTYNATVYNNSTYNTTQPYVSNNYTSNATVPYGYYPATNATNYSSVYSPGMSANYTTYNATANSTAPGVTNQNQEVLENALLEILLADSDLLDMMEMSLKNGQLEDGIEVALPSSFSNFGNPSEFDSIASLMSLG